MYFNENWASGCDRGGGRGYRGEGGRLKGKSRMAMYTACLARGRQGWIGEGGGIRKFVMKKEEIVLVLSASKFTPISTVVVIRSLRRSFLLFRDEIPMM